MTTEHKLGGLPNALKRGSQFDSNLLLTNLLLVKVKGLPLS
jgi:hypothetical protein